MIPLFRIRFPARAAYSHLTSSPLRIIPHSANSLAYLASDLNILNLSIISSSGVRLDRHTFPLLQAMRAQKPRSIRMRNQRSVFRKLIWSSMVRHFP